MRHEEKYICSDRYFDMMEHRLAAILSTDTNQKGDRYHIRSLYFDTEEDRFYQESLNGVDRRSKFRIRFYNMRQDFFRLERKDTIGCLKQKESSIIDKKLVEYAVNGGVMPDDDEGVIRQMHILQSTEGLRPTVVVDYSRTAFIYPIGNVRITFDRDISCTRRIEEFLDPHALLFPVTPAHKHVLEVKYDGILPGFIASLLDTGSLERVSFSKYAYARSVIDGNGRKEDGYEF